MLKIAEVFSSPYYILIACLFFAVTTAFVLARSSRSVRGEEAAAKTLIDLLSRSDTEIILIERLKYYRSKAVAERDLVEYEKSPTPIDKTGLLKAMWPFSIRLRSKSSIGSESDNQAADTAHITYIFSDFVDAYASHSVGRHHEIGLSPARQFFDRERLPALDEMPETADFIVRTGLILTFLGLSAALYTAGVTIEASANAGELTGAIRTLIATAGAKFVISVVALVCAVIVRLAQGRFRRRVTRSAGYLGQTAQQFMPAEFAGSETGSDKTLEEKVKTIASALESASHYLSHQLTQVNNVLPDTIKAAMEGATIAIDKQVVDHITLSNTALLERLEEISTELLVLKREQNDDLPSQEI